MKILFLDQSGKPGGAELCLLDIATHYRDHCLVGLLADGSFRELLEQHQIPVQVLAKEVIQVQKASGWLQSLQSSRALLTPILNVARLSREFDVIYANTQKALVIGAIASLLSRRSLVYHLHDIVSPDHFSASNRRVIITLANRFASLVIANSQASKTAFVSAGGKAEKTTVVYNGFRPERYQAAKVYRDRIRQELGVGDRFVVGHFSRLSPWKGQHILIEALTCCPEEVVAVFVGDALFGEQDYVKQLHQQVKFLNLEHRVHFLGFRSDVPELMAACNLIAHTSTAPEPFGRVIVEAMLCERPIIAAQAGGAAELIQHGVTGWLTPPGDASKLAAMINQCCTHREEAAAIAHQAWLQASQHFHVDIINQQIEKLMIEVTC